LAEINPTPESNAAQEGEVGGVEWNSPHTQFMFGGLSSQMA